MLYCTYTYLCIKTNTIKQAYKLAAKRICFILFFIYFYFIFWLSINKITPPIPYSNFDPAAPAIFFSNESIPPPPANPLSPRVVCLFPLCPPQPHRAYRPDRPTPCLNHPTSKRKNQMQRRTALEFIFRSHLIVRPVHPAPKGTQ